MTNDVIRAERFVLRELTEADVTDRYCEWLRDLDIQKYITAAAGTHTLADLRQYVLERIGRSDVLFLGIFDSATGAHIGNVKYEPVNVERGYAVMGVLIGDAAYRGKGVAGEVVTASARWLQAHRGIKQVLLGVSKDNVAAIRAYEKVGFVVASTPYISATSDTGMTMVWQL